MRRFSFALRLATHVSAVEPCLLVHPLPAETPSDSTVSAFRVAGRRRYVPKVFLRHDVMKTVLAQFLDSKGVPQDAIDTVLATKHFYAFHKAEFEHFERVVVWWSTIGLHSGEAMGCVLRRHPNMLWIDINPLESKMQWFLTTLRFERHVVGDLLTRNPNLLFHHVEILGHFLQLLETTGIRRNQIQRLIRDDPMLLEYCENVEELQSLLRWLNATLELPLATCGKMLLRVPQLMNPVWHEDLPSMYEYLSRLGLETRQIADVFARHPEGLRRKRSQIQALLMTLKARFGLRQVSASTVGENDGLWQREVAEVVAKLPAMLSLRKTALLEVVSFLDGELRLERPQMRELATTHSAMLLLDVRTTLWPRFVFLREIVSVPLNEISAFPHSCSYEIEFLMQRFGFLQKYANVTDSLPLRQVLSRSESAFAASLGKSEAKYRQFMSWWRPPEDWKAALERACVGRPFGERS